jgi:hypothetical protein
LLPILAIILLITNFLGAAFSLNRNAFYASKKRFETYPQKPQPAKKKRETV